ILKSKGKHGKYPAQRFDDKQIIRNAHLELHQPVYKHADSQSKKYPTTSQQHVPESVSTEHETETEEESDHAEIEAVPRHGIQFKRHRVYQSHLQNKCANRQEQTCRINEDRFDCTHYFSVFIF